MFPQKRAATPGTNPLATTQGVVPDETLLRLSHLARIELDALPCGAIQVDDAGVILQFNKGESDMTGFRAQDVEGKNLFFELAPCMNNGLIYGKFREGVAANRLDHELMYALTYRMRPVLTQIRLWRDVNAQTNWVLLKRLGTAQK